MYCKAVDIHNHFLQNKCRPLNFAGADEAELEAALKKSMATFEAEDRARMTAQGDDGQDGGGMVGSVLNRGNNSAAGGGAQSSQQPTFQSFTGTGVSLGGGGVAPGNQMTDEEMAIMASYQDDPELAQAILQSKRDAEAASMVVPEEPAASSDPDTMTTLQIRLPDGSKLLRRFLRANTVQDVVNFVKREKKLGMGGEAVKLATTFPKRVMDDPSKTLTEIGVGR